MGRKIIEKFKEIVGNDDHDSEAVEPVIVNRSYKEAYVCKRLKKSRNELHDMCIAVGIDAMYDELMVKSGKATSGKRVKS